MANVDLLINMILLSDINANKLNEIISNLFIGCN